MKKFIALISAFLSISSVIYAQNVGVDVAMPVEKLDVLGAIRIGNTSNTNAGTIRWNTPNFEGYNGSAWVNLGGGGTVTGTGTATRVAFWNGTNSLSSNANLFWDNTNSRLGIGTSSPAYKLDVSGSDFFSLQLIAPTSPLLKLSGSYNSGNGAEFWQDATGDARLNINGALNAIYMKSTGDIGIGIAFPATPSARLDVNNGSSTVPIFLARDNGTEVMRIADGGNVGIGSATPGAKLDVAGQVKITGGTPGLNKVLTSDAAGLATWVDPTTLGIDATTASNGLTEVGNDIRLGGTLSANTTVAQAANTLAFTSTATNGFSVDGTTFSVDAANNRVGIGTSTPAAKLQVEANAGAEGLHITGSGTQSGLNPVASFWGDLGSSPDQFSKSVNIVNDGASGNLVRLQFTDAAPGVCLSQIESGYNGGLQYLAFRTSTGLGNITEKMRITTTGNVGIGSTAPGAKLEVAGQVKITGGTPALNQVLTSDAAGLATWEPAQGDNLGNHIATQNIQLNGNWLSNDGGNEGIRIDNNGNAGIGLAPGGNAYLDITGTNAGTTSLQLRSGNPGIGTASNQVVMGYNGTENYRHAIKTRHQSGGSGNAIDFFIWDQPNDAAATIGTLNVMSISGLNNGSVGIGVNAPGAQLHTTGSVRLAGLTSDTQTSAVMTDGSGNLSTRALNAVAFTGDLASGDADYIQNQSVGNNFATGQAASFDVTGNAEIGGTLEVNGNVGIGTTTPGGPLQINTPTAGRFAWYHAFGSFSVFNPETFVGEIRVGEASGRPGLYSSGRLELQASATGIIFGSSNAEHMRLTSAGRLGIGTNAPSNLLTVEGPGEQVLLHNPTNDGSIGINFNENSSNAARIHHEGDFSSGYLEFEDYTAGWTGTGLVIKQNNVGIGTISPSTTLDVVNASGLGRIRVSGVQTGYTQADILLQTGTTDGPGGRGTGIYTQNQGNNTTWYFGNPYNTSDQFVINRKAGTGLLAETAQSNASGVSNFMTVLNNGNVGIGSASPVTKLDVNGTATATALAGAFDQSASGYVRIGNMQIAWGTATLASGQSWTTGAGNTKYVLCGQNITFPVAFISAPSVTFGMIDGQIAARSAYVSYFIPSTSDVNNIYLTSPILHSETSGVVVHWTAIGRWQ